MTKKTSKKATKTKDKDIKELQRINAALNGIQHNPIAWAAVIAVVAPVIARLAARYAASYLAKQWNKRANPKIRTGAAEDAAERITDALVKNLKK